MACTNVFVEPMLEDQNFIKRYVEQVQTLKYQGVLPADFQKEMLFNVYSIEERGCGAHRSIVLTADGKHFFTVELGFIEVNGVKRIYPASRKIRPSLKSKLSYHGQVMMSTATLLSKGIATMKKFGDYFKFCNNCQHFCNYYLESIGLGKTKKLTDVAKTSLGIGGIAAGVLAVSLMLLFKK